MGKIKMGRDMTTSRLSLPPLAPIMDSVAEGTDEGLEKEGCPVHFYRDNSSIFSEFVHNPVFTMQKRQLPWEERNAYTNNVVHAYTGQSQRESMHRALARGPHDQWRYVRDHQRRRRPPPPQHKGAVPGSTLDKKREKAVEKHMAERRARVGDEPERVSILKGGSMQGTTSVYMRDIALAPATSVPSIIMPRQSLPALPRLSHQQLHGQQ